MPEPKKFDVTIGADPEFCCLSSSGEGLLHADNYHESNCVGADGGGVAFEIRPYYSTCPLRVVNNIHQNMIQIIRKYPGLNNVEWRAGSYITAGDSARQCIGGHIHFGNLGEHFKPDNACLWMDNYVASLAVLLEDRRGAAQRREGGYGRLSDRRDNSHGFEYRTLSSWLTSPYIAAAILCLAKVVIEHAKADKFSRPTQLLNTDDFNGYRHEKLRVTAEKVWEGITKMELYPKYQANIDLLYRLIAAGKTWFPINNQDIKESWGVVNLDKLGRVKTSVSVGKIWKDVKV